ncbi:uncharacterized protein LOC128230050 [Mya arenaria]|uniref:uncharacterized protein LOC128230050 n=1 Tax=Mya arenaria TaxID=6604 RepID=UPI0022E925BC|nr:uncharacterized protein LOC128230050 [Mya arenaria]
MREYMTSNPVVALTLTLLLLVLCPRAYRVVETWEHVTVRYGVWEDLPVLQSAAFQRGYRRLNDVCKTDYYHGFMFSRGDNTKAMPIYDLNGALAGVQSRFRLPIGQRGYNSQNETISLPPVEVMPPVLKAFSDGRGSQHYTVTAYFNHPSLICSPLVSPGVLPGRGLYIQMGFNPARHFLSVPLHDRDLSPLWVRGSCLPQMGTHYFSNLSRALPCEKLYPLFLMYNWEGQLAAFGWLFQGRPYSLRSNDGVEWFRLTTPTYPFLFDTSQLPPCMFQEGFQVFGIHVYLRRHETLVCPRENPQRYPPSDKAHGNIRHSAPASQQTHDINNNEKIDIRGNYDGVNISRDEQFNSVDIRDKANRKPSSSNDCPVARDSSLILLTSVILLFMSVVR